MSKSSDEISIHVAYPPVLVGQKRTDFSIPFGDKEMRGVEHLVGRDGDLDQVHAALSGDGSRRAVVLSGLGGIGKTQLAIAYAKRHKDNYSAIFWVNIRDESSAQQSFATIAKRILQYHPYAPHLGSIDLAGSLDDVVNAVLAWLGDPDNRRWLVIYDNYDNPRVSGNDAPDAVDVQLFLPDAYQGSIIITTRSTQVRNGRRIPVQKLANPQDGADILSKVSGRALSIEGRYASSRYDSVLTQV